MLPYAVRKMHGNVAIRCNKDAWKYAVRKALKELDKRSQHEEEDVGLTRHETEF